MILVVTQEDESNCPHCPIGEPGAYAEFMYRNGRADLEALLEYTDRMRSYRNLAAALCAEDRESLANILNIPAHRRAIEEP